MDKPAAFYDQKLLDFIKDVDDLLERHEKLWNQYEHLQEENQRLSHQLQELQAEAAKAGEARQQLKDAVVSLTGQLETQFRKIRQLANQSD